MTNPSSDLPTDPATPETAADPTLALAQLGKLLLNREESVGQLLQRLAELALHVISELDDVSVTLVQEGKPHTVAFTGSLAVFLDERQYERGFGPCLDVAVAGGTITVDTADLADSVYPDFARAAASRGITHTVSVGMPIPQRTVGALNMYSRAGHPLSAESLTLAETFAGYGAVVLANAALYHSAVDEAQHMQTAMQTRAVIEQAKGILMITRRCTSEEAFVMLTRASQNQNRKLHDVAADLVARTHTPG